MKKSITILAGLWLMLAASMASAQNTSDELVKATVKNIRDHKNVELTFDYQYALDDQNASEKQQGTAYLQGECYKVQLIDQEIISDGKSIWNYIFDNEEVTLSNTSEGEDNTPLKLITMLDKDYTAKSITSEADKAQQLERIQLSNPKGQFKEITAVINPKEKLLKNIIFHFDDGSSMVLENIQMKFDQNLKDNFFRFDSKANPNIDIIDMR